MSKNKNPPSSQGRMTKKQLSRHERDVQLSNYVRNSLIVVIFCVTVVIGFALFNQLYQKPNRVIATVNGQEIPLRLYWAARKIELIQASIGQQQQQDPAALKASIDAVDTTEEIDPATLSALVDDMILEQSAAKMGITISKDQLKNLVNSRYAPQPTATTEPSQTVTIAPTLSGSTPTLAPLLLTSTVVLPQQTQTPVAGPPLAPTSAITSSTTLTPTATHAPTPKPVFGTPTLTTTPNPDYISKGATQYQNIIKNLTLNAYGISEDDFLNTQYKPQFLHQMVAAKLASDFGLDKISSAPQVFYRHITAKGKSSGGLDANAEALKQAGNDPTQQDKLWTQYLPNTADTNTKDLNGEVGWLMANMKGKEANDSIFNIDGTVKAHTRDVLGPFYDAIKDESEIIQILQIDASRPVETNMYSTISENNYLQWFHKNQDAALVNYYPVRTPTATAQPTFTFIATVPPAPLGTPMSGPTILSGTPVPSK